MFAWFYGGQYSGYRTYGCAWRWGSGVFTRGSSCHCLFPGDSHVSGDYRYSFHSSLALAAEDMAFWRWIQWFSAELIQRADFLYWLCCLSCWFFALLLQRVTPVTAYSIYLNSCGHEGIGRFLHQSIQRLRLWVEPLYLTRLMRTRSLDSSVVVPP